MGRKNWTDGKCKRGHDVTDPANVSHGRDGSRCCRACKRLSDHARYKSGRKKVKRRVSHLKDRCVRGHSLKDPSNVIAKETQTGRVVRWCRTCKRMRAREQARDWRSGLSRAQCCSRGHDLSVPAYRVSVERKDRKCRVCLIIRDRANNAARANYQWDLTPEEQAVESYAKEVAELQAKERCRRAVEHLRVGDWVKDPTSSRDDELYGQVLSKDARYGTVRVRLLTEPGDPLDVFGGALSVAPAPAASSEAA